MRVKCMICDKSESISDESPIAKKLRNRPIHTYTCSECYARIKIKTEQRIATGNFRFLKPVKDNDEW
ncbi:YlaI family protein [Bacillus sp. AFS029533]|uniref:YlaI family protein n=1 Tax=Bacillus sp. AFS029533 TaxID=2033494 RepID=UPI000BFBD92B|nr:YlaI family protein [Bacillus sp. AFS029533]PGZ91434.1 hypothetical protein COE53_14595 [Bacillus sp. AFS029533]